MTYSSADHAVLAYLRLKEDLSCAKAFDFISQRGTRCSKCGRGPKTTIRTRKGEREVCSCCRKDWQGEERIEVKGQVQAGRRTSAYEDKHSELRVLRQVIEPRARAMRQDEWEFHVVALIAYLDPRVFAETGQGGYYGVVEFGRGYLPGYAWTEWTVRRAIKAARRVIEDRLARRGMLTDGA